MQPAAAMPPLRTRLEDSSGASGAASSASVLWVQAGGSGVVFTDTLTRGYVTYYENRQRRISLVLRTFVIQVG